MKQVVLRNYGFSFLFTLMVLNSSATPASRIGDSLIWKSIEKNGYTLHYTAGDQNLVRSIDGDIRSGIAAVTSFFNNTFLNRFDVYVFPGRDHLDKQWQKDWGDTSFHSECWMIASGVAHRLDILSPNVWQNQACEHNGSDTGEIRRVLWHELTHV